MKTNTKMKIKVKEIIDKFGEIEIQDIYDGNLIIDAEDATLTFYMNEEEMADLKIEIANNLILSGDMGNDIMNDIEDIMYGNKEHEKQLRLYENLSEDKVQDINNEIVKYVRDNVYIQGWDMIELLYEYQDYMGDVVIEYGTEYTQY